MAEYQEIFGIARYIRMSPYKVRLVANLVRGKRVDDAIGILSVTPKAAAREVIKAIKAAAANATNNYGFEREHLYITTILADEGPRLKRIKAGARGRYKPIIKRSTHITVGVAERTEES
jgi:large subunit ribosomal protein L22